MNRVGSVIRRARLRNGVSQKGLALRIGVQSDGQISKIESGKERLAFHRLRKACLFLGLSYGSVLKLWMMEFEKSHEERGHRNAKRRLRPGRAKRHVGRRPACRSAGPPAAT